MKITPITELHPKEDTPAAIRAALISIEGEREGAQAAITAASEARDRLMLEGEPRQVREADTKLADARIRLDQLDALTAKLRADLEPAAERETREHQDRVHAKAVAAMRLDAERWDQELPPLTAAIRSLIEKRRAMIEQLRAASIVCARRHDLPNLFGFIDRLAQSTAGTLPMTDADREAAWHVANKAHEERRRMEREFQAEQLAAMDQRLREEEEARCERVIVHRVTENTGFQVGRIDPNFIRR